MEPEKLAANAIFSALISAECQFWKKACPANILPNAFYIPAPVAVSVFILMLIQDILPRSVIIFSFCSMPQIATDSSSELILYFTKCLFYIIFKFFVKPTKKQKNFQVIPLFYRIGKKVALNIVKNFCIIVFGS